MEATSSTKPNLQKKVFSYARDIALDKLNKKLDKRIAKQQIRKKEHENVLYQPVSQSSDYITPSSELTSSHSDATRFSHSSDTFVTTARTKGSGNNGYGRNLSNRNEVGVGQSTASNDSSDQDEDYDTANEDEDEQFSTEKEKPTEFNKIPSNEDFIVDIPDDKNDKSVVKPTLPQSPTPTPHHHHQHHTSGAADYSGYIQKKSLAQGMMDLALVSANTNQLRYIIEYKEHHPYFMTSLSLVIASLLLQLAVGMTLIWNTRFNVKKRKEMQEADKVNNFSVIGIFIVTLINVFLSTFGGAPQSGGALGGTKTEIAILGDDIQSSATDPIIPQM